MALSTVAMLGALGSFVSHLTESPLRAGVSLVLLCLSVYLFHVNRLLSGTPEEVRRLSPHRWTRNQIRAAYRTLEQRPITTESFAGQVPPKLERRYIVTGGSGLVGGYIVLQLLARGQDPSAIRIVDFQAPHRRDMLSGPASRVGFVKTDITSEEAVESAFSKTWPTGIKQLPVTVFHTAAVIVPSDRSRLVYGFCEAVNVGGTINVLEAAKRLGADVLIMTSSASISIRPVEPWVRPWQWKEWPKHYWQLLDEADFFEPPREHEGYFANYPASKARAERIVCAANGRAMRTGCIRPANGVYGHPTDNTVGGPLNMQTYPAWSGHIVQSFVHGANCAIAHLQMEAVLAKPDSASAPQAGRPFTITDPNPPIAYADLWLLVKTLSVTPFRTIPLLPVPMLLLSHVIEVYSLLPMRFPCLKWFMPPIPGNAKHLKPALFSITTHLFANNQAARKPVQEGGLGYTGVLGTLDGMSQELLEWNHEHLETSPLTKTKHTSSVSLAEEIERIRSAAAKIRLPSSSG